MTIKDLVFGCVSKYESRNAFYILRRNKNSAVTYATFWNDVSKTSHWLMHTIGTHTCIGIQGENSYESELFMKVTLNAICPFRGRHLSFQKD